MTLLLDLFCWSRFVAVRFSVTKPCLNLMKFYMMKVDILRFNLMGNRTQLDQWIEKYDFSKFKVDSGMESVADWV